MNRVVLTLLLATCSGIAQAGFDYACLETCANEGNIFQFCTSKCAVQELPSTQMPAMPPSSGKTQLPASPNPVPDQALADQTLKPATLMPTINKQCLVDCANDGYKKEFCAHLCTF